MTEHLIRPIDAEDTRALRHAVLRPGQPFEATRYEEDAAPETAHFGCFRAGKLVGVASVYREPSPKAEDAQGWRLRGMATDPEVRGLGCGRALLNAVAGHAAGQGGDLLWCNARSTAAGFYLGAGFRQIGTDYDVPGLGPHYFMQKRLSGAETSA